MFSPPPPPPPPAPSIQGPAVGLIATGVLNGISALYLLASTVFQLATSHDAETFSDNAERVGYIAGYYTSTIMIALFSLVGLTVAPYIVYAGIHMMRFERLGAARKAAILSMVPLTSCCCVAGIPFGLWAYSALNRLEVQSAFRD